LWLIEVAATAESSGLNNPTARHISSVRGLP
jgi:hypothetical protein